MATLSVQAPVEGYSGVTAGVVFDDGVGHVDESNVSALAYFRRAGYRVSSVEVGGSDDEGSSRALALEPPARSASKAAWVAYAVECGAEESEAKASSKAELVATYGGAS